jgi:hypothetical protein
MSWNSMEFHETEVNEISWNSMEIHVKIHEIRFRQGCVTPVVMLVQYCQKI